MADFESWQHVTLVKFAEDSQAERAKLLDVLAQLLTSYEKICDQMCKKPTRDAAYVAAKEILK